MKKFLSMLTLVLALCLACGAALAEEAQVTYDYTNPEYVQTGASSYIVRFKSTTTDTDGNYKFIEYPLYVEEPKYTKLDALTVNSVTDGLVRVKKLATCTAPAVLELKPTNVGVRTSVAEALTPNGPFTAATQQDMAHSGYSFYGLPQKFAKNSTLDMEALQKENFRVYMVWSERYKALGHLFTSFRTEKEATCDEPGVVYPVCSRTGCGVEDDAVVTDPKGHKGLLANPEVLYTNNVSGMVQVTENATGKKYVYTLIAEPYCEREGVYVGYCTVCKDENALFSIDKVEGRHKYGDWIIEENATCTRDGNQYRLCTVCLKDKQIQTIDALGHDLVPNVIKAATCLAEGSADKITCSRCKSVATPVSGQPWGIAVSNNLMATSMREAINEQGIYALNTVASNLFVLPEDLNNHPADKWVKKIDECVPATCTEDGLDVYYCDLCKAPITTTTAIVPAKGHKPVTVTQKLVGNTWVTLNPKQVPTCELQANGEPYTYRSLTYCLHEVVTDENNQVDYHGTPAGYPTSKAEALLPEEPYEVVENEVIAPDHTFTAWMVRNEPTAGTPGYWFRDCTVCKKHEEYIGYVAPGTGLTLGDDGIFYYYKDGVFDPTFNGLVEYNGGTFLAVNGKVDGSVSGLKLVSDEFLFFANNQLQAVNTFAIYDGAMFVIKAGKLDLTANGLLDYDGGKFVFAAGKLQSQANGLWLNPADNTWCFLANGQLQAQYSGIASYNGALFLLKDGKLATGAAGTYEQDGVKYIVDDAGNAAIAA